MVKNMNQADRIFRIILAAVIIVLGIVNESWWGLIGIIPLATAVIGTCPAYLPFGATTKEKIKVEKLKTK